MELNLENTREFPLSDELREKLLTEAEECVMSWSTVDGWPMASCHWPHLPLARWPDLDEHFRAQEARQGSAQATRELHRGVGRGQRSRE